MRTIAAIVCVGGLVAGAAVARTPEAERPLLEGSMQVRGTVSVDATGAVTAYSLYSRTKLPEPVRTLLDGVLPTFRFKPVEHDGHPAAVDARMSLQVVANEIDHQHISVALHSAYFTETKDVPRPEAKPALSTDMIWLEHREAVRYPAKAQFAGVTGTVYVALRIDRSGHIVQADVQKVDLSYWENDDAKIPYWRDMLAQSAIAGVSKFTFHMPTTGPNADKPFLTGILPVTYLFDQPDYGQWVTYLPGPKHEIPWPHDDLPDADNSEAVPDGEFALAGSGLKLLTPLGGG
jgi:hypothetical protein